MHAIAKSRLASGFGCPITNRCTSNFAPTSPHPPAAQGLYDPRHEHDACGVGFIAHIKGQKSHAIVSQALQLLINLLHRGACGCEVNTGDGAGILMQMPDRFFRKEAARLGIALPEERGYGAGLVFLPHDQAARDRVETLFEEIVIDEGQLVLGWRDVPTDISGVGPSAVRRSRRCSSSSSSGAGPALPPVGRSLEGDAQFERKLYVIRKRIEHAIDASDLPPDEKKFFYVVSLSSNTLIYKGMLTADQIGPMFPDLLDPAMESALALVHQRFSTNTFPSWPLAHPVPLRRPQRRNQHAARQHQLDEGARGAAALGRARPRPQEDPADHPRGRQRHGDLRQRARAAGDGGPLASARRADDDPRAVAEPRGDEPGPARLLRVPLVADGAVGRPGLDRVHRRHGHRRRARSQRPAAVALLRDEGRPRDHGVGGRRPRRAAGGYRAQGASASRADPAGRHGAGADHLRRGDQGAAGAGAAVRRVARAAPHRDRGRAGRAVSPAAGSPDGAPPPAGVRLHAGGRHAAPRADGARGRRAAGVHGHRHAARRAVGAPAAPLRLFQAALRAGDEPAARRDPGRARHVDGIDDRSRAQPARAGAGVVPPDQRPVPDHRQRSAREAAAHQLDAAAWLPIRDAADDVRPARRRRGARARDGSARRRRRARRSRAATRS